MVWMCNGRSSHQRHVQQTRVEHLLPAGRKLRAEGRELDPVPNIVETYLFSSGQEEGKFQVR